MKSSIIIKALAFAMLMPALLFMAACSSDFINDEGSTDPKGFTLPVTVKVTYQSDPSTKATYNEETKKLSFSTGDKLFVKGQDSWQERTAKSTQI